MLFRLRLLCLLGGVVLFLPLITVPAFVLRTLLVIFGFSILWLSYNAHKHASLLLHTYKELKDHVAGNSPSPKKNNYV